LGERPGTAGITGIVLVVLGVLVLGAPGRRAGSPPATQATPATPAMQATPAAQAAPASRAVIFALVTGTFIASYTLWDKYAVSTLQVPPLMQGYASLPVIDRKSVV